MRTPVGATRGFAAVIIGAATLLAVVGAGALEAAPNMRSAANVATASPSESPAVAPTADPAVVSAERASLPSSAVQVDCAPGLKTLPADTRLNRPLGFYATHPGFYTLSDGTCWNDPKAIASPISPASVDAP